MFKHAIPVDEITKIPTDFTGVIEPEIARFNFNLGTEVMEVAYYFKVYDARKQIIEIIYASGRSRRDTYRDPVVTTFLREMAEKAITNAMAQFMIAFNTNPKIQQRLYLNDKSENNIIRQ